MLECEKSIPNTGYGSQDIRKDTTCNQCNHRDTPASLCAGSQCVPAPYSTSWKSQSHTPWEARARLLWHCSGLASSISIPDLHSGEAAQFIISRANTAIWGNLFLYMQSDVFDLADSWGKSNHPPSPSATHLPIHAPRLKHLPFSISIRIWKTRPAREVLVGWGFAGSNVHTKRRHSLRLCFFVCLLEINIVGL